MMAYQCKQCGTETEIPNIRSQQAERLQKPCENCGDVTCYELAVDLPDDLDDKARDMLRAVNPTILINTSNSGTKRLHIKDGDVPLCGSSVDMREVDVAAYPPGYYPWCQHCVSVLRDEPAYCSGGNSRRDATKDDVIRAIQQADDETDGYLTREDYRDRDQPPTIYDIKNLFGKWSNAREVALGDSK